MYDIGMSFPPSLRLSGPSCVCFCVVSWIPPLCRGLAILSCTDTACERSADNTRSARTCFGSHCIYLHAKLVFVTALLAEIRSNAQTKTGCNQRLSPGFASFTFPLDDPCLWSLLIAATKMHHPSVLTFRVITFRGSPNYRTCRTAQIQPGYH